MFKINEDKMPEAEVSLRLAFYLINEELVNSDVHVSIDGAQIETNEKTHFDIRDFLECEGWIKQADSSQSFYGIYSKLNYKKIEIKPDPGFGDVTATFKSGNRLRVECKKGLLKKSSSNPEYRLLREALGQILTIKDKDYSENDLIAVAVPKSEKFSELAKNWREAPLIKKIGIQILLVDRENYVEGLII